jgi:hypothetical protein
MCNDCLTRGLWAHEESKLVDDFAASLLEGPRPRRKVGGYGRRVVIPPQPPSQPVVQQQQQQQQQQEQEQASGQAAEQPQATPNTK